MRTIVLVVLVMVGVACEGQGVNNFYLLGYSDTVVSPGPTAAIDFETGFPVLTTLTNRKMKFQETQGNISDSNGNLLMYSNGRWIADATNDTMLNGSGLNPSPCNDNFAFESLAIPNGNVFIPYPGDSQKYVLFHMTCNSSLNLRASEIYYSVIDITQNGGLGKVILKNQIAFQDTLMWGIGACKHANGRDWWIVAMRDQSDVILKFLFTPTGVQSISSQHLGTTNNYYQNASQLTFSPDGSKFAYTSTWRPANWVFNVKVLDFDRCSGNFSNPKYIDCTDGSIGMAAAFSPNSKYLYASTFSHLYQMNTDTTNVAASLDTIAAMSNWLLYLASDGKIYITKGNGGHYISYINSPDSEGVACDIHPYVINIPCYNLTAPNHPNYFLGPLIDSPCDTITTSTTQISNIKYPISIYPNPTLSNSQLTFTYPSSGSAREIVVNDVNGKEIARYALPKWSTIHTIKLPEMAKGFYVARLTGEGASANVKFVVQ